MIKLLKINFFITLDNNADFTALDQKFSSWDEGYIFEDYRLVKINSKTNKLYRDLARTFVIYYINLDLQPNRLNVEVYTKLIDHLVPFLLLIGSAGFIHFKIDVKLALVPLFTSLFIIIMDYLYYLYVVKMVEKEVCKLI